MWTDLTPAEWIDDLDQLIAAAGRDHADLHHQVSHGAIRQAILALRRRVPRLAAHEIVIEMAGLLALVGDGHTALRLPSVPGFRRFPLRLYRFSDGVFVRSVDTQHAAINGGRVVAIEDVPILEAWDRVRPLISRDNEMGVWSQVPGLLEIPEVLHALRLTSSPERASWTIERSSGDIQTAELHATQGQEPDLLDARFRTRMADPLWLRRPEENWLEHLPDLSTLYLAYNTVQDGAPEPLADLFARALELVATEGIDRFILDIRRNGGGNMDLNWPLVDGLIRAERVNRWGHLFVITGRGTFSAAMNLAVDLEQRTQVLFVGEPTGARPNHYGENVDVTLTNSGLRATISGMYWQCSLPGDERDWIVPDLPVRLASTDYLQQRDPAVDAILGFPPGAAINTSDDPPFRLRRKMARA